MMKLVLISLSVATLVTGYSFECHLCDNPNCVFASTDKAVQINNAIVNRHFDATYATEFGPNEPRPSTCSDYESLAFPRQYLPPDVCSEIKQVAGNPGRDVCNCRHRNGGPCPDVGVVNQAQTCNVCEYDGYVVGDPNQIVFHAGISFTCGDVEQNAPIDGFLSCNQAKNIAREFCQCYDPISEPPPTKCLGTGAQCNPLYDGCCEPLQSCVWRNAWSCSQDPAFPNPPLPPTMAPTPAPQAPVYEAPPLEGCAAFLDPCDGDGLPCCDDLQCEYDRRVQSNGQPLGYVCKPPAGEFKDCLSMAAGEKGGSASKNKDC